VLAVLKDIQATFPDVRFAPLEFVADGEWVVVRGMFSGTHRGVGWLPVNGGPLVGAEPTGRHFEVQHIHMAQFRGGKIVEHFANRDDLGMMQQLGLLSKP
jgi:predicted ester cyclase